MPRTYKKKYLDPKGHPIPDNFRQVSRLRDKAKRAARKSKRRKKVVKFLGKVERSSLSRRAREALKLK